MSVISDLVAFVKADTSNTEEKEVSLGTIPNWQGQNIAQATGIHVKQAAKILTAYAVTHIFKRHGDNAEEQKRGQVGVTEKDLELLPAILSNPDSVTKGTSGNRGQQALIFMKKYKGQYYVVCTVFRGNRNVRLEVNTMYIKK